MATHSMQTSRPQCLGAESMIWFKRPAISLGSWPSLSMPLTAFPSPGLPGESDKLYVLVAFSFLHVTLLSALSGCLALYGSLAATGLRGEPTAREELRLYPSQREKVLLGDR